VAPGEQSTGCQQYHDGDEAADAAQFVQSLACHFLFFLRAE
jgi:hypothetical protein